MMANMGQRLRCWADRIGWQARVCRATVVGDGICISWVISAGLLAFLLVLFAHLGLFVYQVLAHRGAIVVGLPAVLQWPDILMSVGGAVGLVYFTFWATRAFPWKTIAVFIVLILDGIYDLRKLFSVSDVNVALEYVPLLRFAGLISVAFLFWRFIRAFGQTSAEVYAVLGTAKIASIIALLAWELSRESSVVAGAWYLLLNGSWVVLLLLSILFIVLGAVLGFFARTSFGAPVPEKICVFKGHPKLSYFSLPFLLYLAYPPYFCLGQLRFLSDEDFIEMAVRNEIPRGIDTDGTKESIQRYRAIHPDCCEVSRRAVIADKFFCNGDTSEIFVTLRFPVRSEVVTEKVWNTETKSFDYKTINMREKTGNFYESLIWFNPCGGLLRRTGAGHDRDPWKLK